MTKYVRYTTLVVRINSSLVIRIILFALELMDSKRIQLIKDESLVIWLMNLSELPDLVLENITQFLKDVDVLSLQRVNRALYLFLTPYCEKIPTIFNIWKTNERLITNVHKNQHFQSNLPTCTFRIDSFGWNCDYAHLGFLFKIHHHSDVNLNFCILIKFLKSHKIIKLGWSFTDFFKNEPQSNMRTLFQPEQICLLLNHRGVIIHIPTFDAQIHAFDFENLHNHNFSVGTSLDGCTVVNNSLIIYHEGMKINYGLAISTDLRFYQKVLCVNDQYSFLTDSSPRFFINYKKCLIVEQKTPRHVDHVIGVYKNSDNYFAFEYCGQFLLKVYHMNHTITQSNIWIWKLIRTHHFKNRDIKFVYCPILDRILELNQS
jgi:hypothetical protein